MLMTSSPAFDPIAPRAAVQCARGRAAQRVDYELTKLGSTLWEAVEPLSSWARNHVSEVLTSRKQFDERDAG
jgi:hypothetical protein